MIFETDGWGTGPLGTAQGDGFGVGVHGGFAGDGATLPMEDIGPDCADYEGGNGTGDGDHFGNAYGEGFTDGDGAPPPFLARPVNTFDCTLANILLRAQP